MAKRAGSGRKAAARSGPPRAISSRYFTRSRNCCRSASRFTSPAGISEAGLATRSAMAASGITTSAPLAARSRSTSVAGWPSAAGVSRARMPVSVRPSSVTMARERYSGRIDFDGSSSDSIRWVVSRSPWSAAPSESSRGPARFGPSGDAPASAAWHLVQVSCAVWKTMAPRAGSPARSDSAASEATGSAASASPSGRTSAAQAAAGSRASKASPAKRRTRLEAGTRMLRF